MRNVSLLRMDGKQTEKYGRHLSIQIQNTLNELINWSALLMVNKWFYMECIAIIFIDYLFPASADRNGVFAVIFSNSQHSNS